ncbi:MAG: hypothetical protein IT464_06245 [Planctomycetes bacterium]|nr:hypothetical protein [Planctomycetota bacterium]
MDPVMCTPRPPARELQRQRAPWQPLVHGVLLAALLASLSQLSAQSLPDINRLEVENARLVLLDQSGRRQGMLEGKYARKRADGRVEIEQAKLTIARQDGSFELVAPLFSYAPTSNAFDCSEGMQAKLPDGGELQMPAGSGTIEFKQGINLTMTGRGNAKLRTGDSMVSADMQDPTVELDFSQAGEGDKRVLEFRQLRIAGLRGARMNIKLDNLPNLDGTRSKQAEVLLSCFGDASLLIAPVPGSKKDQPLTHRATVSLLRRASMTLQSEQEEGAQATFRITSGTIELRGNVLRNKRQGDSEADQADKDKKDSTTLGDIELDAVQNVRMVGQAFVGSGSVLHYRERAGATELRLEGEPELTLQRGLDDAGQPLSLYMRASGFINVDVPTPEGTTTPTQADVELFDGARVQRLSAGKADWLVQGRQVRLFSWQDSPDSYSHSFDVVAEGYSPLLRVYAPLAADANDRYRVNRATLYGIRAEGTMVGDRSDVRVYGPDILAVVSADFPLADVIGAALGLRPRPRRETMIPARDGRLTIRAAVTLELGLTGASGGGDLRVAGRGDVTLDHETLPRDDSALLTLTGEFIALDVQNNQLRAAALVARDGADALATLGYDLLITRSLAVHDERGALVTDVTGPGRLVARDPASVKYFRDAFNRLPRRSNAKRNLPEPDAAWLDFGGDCRGVSSATERTLEIGQPAARLVNGEFEKPRAGRAAVNDLAELTQPEVTQLYFVTGQRAFLRSFKVGDAEDVGDAEGASSTVNLLRLEGDAVVRSRLDGVRATASVAIELSGAEQQRAEQSPLAVVLLGVSELRVDDAGEFFGEYVKSGVFAYDSVWTLNANDRLEVTLRPVDTAFPGMTEGFASVLLPLGDALSAKLPPDARLSAAETARVALRRLLGDMTHGDQPAAEVEQPVRALNELEVACPALADVARMYLNGDTRWRTALPAAEGPLRRADRLLGSLIDVAGRGGVSGRFESSRGDTPSLNLAMQDVLITFNGLGEVIGVDATGPIVVSRDAYTLRGSSLSRRADGALVLDGAQISLPPDTGVQVDGVDSISLVQREKLSLHTSPGQYDRTMVTRVTGRNLKVRITLEQE